MTNNSTSQARVISLREVGKALGIGRTSVFNLLKSGQLRAIRLGGKVCVTNEEIDRLLAEATPARQGHL